MHAIRSCLSAPAARGARGARGAPVAAAPVSAASQDAVYRFFAQAKELSSLELASGVEQFAEEGLRTPVRDLASFLSSKALAAEAALSAEDLSVLTRCLAASGRLQVYEPRLFDILIKHRECLAVSELAVVLYECGRHGLRAKHYSTMLTDAISGRRGLAGDLTSKDVWRLWAGVMKYPREHRLLLLKTLPTMERMIGNFSVRELSVPMRICKEMRGLREFRKFQVLVSQTVGERIVGEWDTERQARLISDVGIVMSASEKYEETLDAVYGGVIAKTIELLERCESYENVLVVALIDIMFTLSTWRSKQPRASSTWTCLSPTIAARLNDELVSRRTEIKYSPNCGLWHVVVMASDALADKDGVFPFTSLMFMVATFCRDHFMLARISVWQVMDVFRVFVRRRVYDEGAYKAIAEVISEHINEIQDVRKLSSLFYSFALAAHRMDQSSLLAFAARFARAPVPSDVVLPVLWTLAVQRCLQPLPSAVAQLEDLLLDRLKTNDFSAKQHTDLVAQLSHFYQLGDASSPSDLQVDSQFQHLGHGDALVSRAGGASILLKHKH